MKIGLNRDCPDQTDSSNHVTLWDGSNYKSADQYPLGRPMPNAPERHDLLNHRLVGHSMERFQRVMPMTNVGEAPQQLAGPGTKSKLMLMPQ